MIHENRIEFNENGDVFKDLNEVPLSEYCFPYKYVDAEVNKKFDKTKGRLAVNEMEKETKHYVESLNQNNNGLKTFTIEIDKFLIDHEYIIFFAQMYMQWRKNYGSTSSFQKLIIPCLPLFEGLDLSQLLLYIEAQTMTQCFVCSNCKNTIFI